MSSLHSRSRREIDLESELLEVSSQLEFLAEVIPLWRTGDFEPTLNARGGLEAILSNLAGKVMALSEVASKTGGQGND